MLLYSNNSKTKIYNNENENNGNEQMIYWNEMQY